MEGETPVWACSFLAYHTLKGSPKQTPSLQALLCGLCQGRGAARATAPSFWPSASARSCDSLMENIHPFWASSLFHHFNKLRTDWKAGNIVSQAQAPTFQLNYRICFAGLARGSWDAAQTARHRVETKRPEKAIQIPAQPLTRGLRQSLSPLWASSPMSRKWRTARTHPSQGGESVSNEVEGVWKCFENDQVPDHERNRLLPILLVKDYMARVPPPSNNLALKYWTKTLEFLEERPCSPTPCSSWHQEDRPYGTLVTFITCSCCFLLITKVLFGAGWGGT